MSSKTLSTGTLSLRFMQNAHRAKQLAQVEAEQAQVKDEAEWEVSKEIRDAWGISAGTSTSEKAQSVSYEASYIPLLFDHDMPSDVQKAKGRRIFNKSGLEVEEEGKADDTGLGVKSSNQVVTADHSKSLKRPTTISGSSSTAQKSPKVTKAKKDPSRSAKEMIRDTSGVGTDLRSTTFARPSTLPSRSLGNSFLKPSGVDEPLNSTKQADHDSDASPEARLKPKGSSKRERETAPENDKEGKKKKKKKKAINE